LEKTRDEVRLRKAEHAPVEHGVASADVVVQPDGVVAEQLPDVLAVAHREHRDRDVLSRVVERIGAGGGESVGRSLSRRRGRDQGREYQTEQGAEHGRKLAPRLHFASLHVWRVMLEEQWPGCDLWTTAATSTRRA